jgi:hypothetical protein
MIKIAGTDLKTSRPSDLDAKLIASTGCAAKEIETLLAAGPDRAARALAPFLDKDAPALNELAQRIAGDPLAVPAIRKLYADVPAPVEKVEPK